MSDIEKEREEREILVINIEAFLRLHQTEKKQHFLPVQPPAEILHILDMLELSKLANT